MTQTPLQKRLCVSVFLLNPLELPQNTDTYAETTVRFCFSATTLELPHNANAYAETNMRFCFSAESPDGIPQRRCLCTNDSAFLLFR